MFKGRKIARFLLGPLTIHLPCLLDRRLSIDRHDPFVLPNGGHLLSTGRQQSDFSWHSVMPFAEQGGVF